MRRLPVRAAVLASSLVIVAAPAATAAEDGLRATTVRDGLTYTSTLSAPEGTSGQWYVHVMNAAVKPQTLLAVSEIGVYPGKKTLSVTIPDSAFGSSCSLLVQVDVRFGGTRHRTTQHVPGGVRRDTVTKPDCKPDQPKPPPTVVPPTVVPPAVTPPTVSRPPASRGVKAAFVARAVPASVTFTG